MTSSLKIRMALTFTALIAASSCAPARWAENPGQSSTNDGLGNRNPQASPSPAPPVQGPKVAQRFEQDQNANKVDILIVNDNSASMDTEQTKMGARFGSLISAFAGIDYHIAMTTTDLDSAKWALRGKIMTWAGTTTKILTPATPNAENVFKATVPRSETIGCRGRNGGRDCPSGNEQPLKAIMMAADERHGANKDFFRDGVDFVAIVLSDEDEMSTGPATATLPQQVIDRVKAAFGSDKPFAVHGVIVKPGDTACKAEQDRQIPEGFGAAFGTRVSDLAGLTFGSTNSICDADYRGSLTAISEKVRQLLSSFELDRTPDPRSVTVTLTPAQNIGFKVEGKRVIFERAPQASTRIEIEYVAID